MAIAPKSIASGVALGLAVGAAYIAYDLLRTPEPDAGKAAVSATASATAAPPPPPPTVATAAPASGGAREGMVKVEGATTFQPTFAAKPVEVKPFWLDATEVTQKAYLACVESSGCGPNGWARSGVKLEGPAERTPAADVSWEDARAFCGWTKKRLPTEVEWELAARGPEGRKYPWGQDAPLDQLCWRSNQGACEVGSYPRGDTPLGLKDLAGNVWEWTAEEAHCANPDKPESCYPRRHTARGGGWNTFSTQLVETTYRNAITVATNYVGFRCAAD